MDQSSDITAPVTKLLTAWAAVGITSWADFASFLAAMYTAVLLGEWFWKRWLRGVFIARGWFTPTDGAGQ